MVGLVTFWLPAPQGERLCVVCLLSVTAGVV